MKRPNQLLVMVSFVFSLNALVFAHEGHMHDHGTGTGTPGTGGMGTGSTNPMPTTPTPVPAFQAEIKMTSTLGKNLILTFNAEPTVETVEAKLCADQANVLQSAVLWMPGMNHGSAPTKLEPDSSDLLCTKIKNILFIMGGAWEIRLTFDDTDTANIPVIIPEDVRVSKVKSTSKMRMRLMFPELPTTMTHSATICTEKEVDITAVKLWMPHHGHGSAPTTLEKIVDQSACTQVNDIEFIMTGLWELQVTFANGDVGVFNVTINN